MEQHISDLLLFLLVLGGPLPLSLTAVLAAEGGARRGGPASSLLALLAAWCVSQAVVGLALGGLGLLRPAFVFAAQAAMLVGGALLLLRVLAALPPRTLGQSFSLPRRPSAVEAVTVGSVCALGLALLWRVSVQPITEHDSLAYHLPAMATWYQAGSFEQLIQLPLFKHYPYTWEALCALFLIPFREDFLVALPAVLAWVIFGLATYGLARSLGATASASLGSAALVLSLPILARNVNTMHVDLPLGAFFMAALYFGLRYLQGGSGAQLGLCLASAGMVAGMKTSGLYYALLVTVLVAASAVFSSLLGRRAASAPRHTSSGPRSPGEVAVLVLGTGCGLLIGLFWYVRNWLEIGNPLGPVRVDLAGITILPGALPADHFYKTSLASVFAPWSYMDWRILLEQIWQQFGFALVALGVLALMAVPGLASRRRRIGAGRLVGLAALTIVTACLYAMTPYGGDNGTHRGLLHPSIGPSMRYAFPFCGALAATAAAGATAAGISGSILLPAAAVVAVHRVLAVNGFAWLWAPIAFSLMLWAVSARPAFISGRRARVGLLLVGLMVGCLALAAATLRARRERDRNRVVAYGPILTYISSELRPDETIGYFLSNRSYLLYGKNLRQRVVHIPLEFGDPEEWLSFIEENDIDVIAAGPCGATHRNADSPCDWLTRGPLPFERVFGDGISRRPFLYRLKRRETDTVEGHKTLPAGETPSRG